MTAATAYAAGAAGVITVTVGQPFWWTAVGLAGVSVTVVAAAPRSVREALMPLVVMTAGVAVISIAPVAARALGLLV